MAALGEELLGYNQLRKAKNQMIGQITLASENYENMMLSSGKSFLIYDKVDELEAVCEEVGGITPELLRQVAREIFAQDKQSVLIYK
jgi:predicted Zn-dependent peptidase